MSEYLSPVTPIITDEDDELNNVMQEMVVGITGLPSDLVRPRWQRVPPQEPTIDTNWCAVGVQGDVVPDDGPYLGHVDKDPGAPTTNTGVTNLQRHLRFEVVASFFGPACRTYGGILRDGMSIEQNRWTLQSLGIGIREIGRSVFIPDMVGKEWRSRTDQMLSFRRQIDRTYNVRSFRDYTVNIAKS